MLGASRIEDVRPGDYVYAKDVKTGEQGYMPVLETFANEVTTTYTVTMEGKSIETTCGHPFYVEEEGWVGADELEAGDRVELSDGNSATVDSVKRNDFEDPVTVYNFAVMDYHTYYAGEAGVLVHNTGCKKAVEKMSDALEEGSSRGGSGSKFQEVFDLADNYKLSDDTFNNHILDRHGFNSTYGNKSHFNTDFDIKYGIDSTLKGDNFIMGSNTAGRDGYIFEQIFTSPIGTNSKGKPLNTLKVVIDELGKVVTAFPKK